MADFVGHPGRGPKASHVLTFTPDHPIGAGQSAPCAPQHSRATPPDRTARARPRATEAGPGIGLVRLAAGTPSKCARLPLQAGGSSGLHTLAGTRAPVG